MFITLYPEKKKHQELTELEYVTMSKQKEALKTTWVKTVRKQEK